MRKPPKYWHADCHHCSVRAHLFVLSNGGGILKLSKFYCLPVLAIAVGLSAEVSPAASGFPANRQVIAFLTNSIDWYHHCVIDRQIAINQVDLVFLEDNRTGAAQILQLSFDFARAEAVATATAPASDQKAPAIVTGPPELAQLVQLASKTESQRRDAIEEIEVIDKKLMTARGADRRDLDVALDAAQSRLDVLQAGLATLRQLVEFMQAFTSRETGDLSSTIDDLARTVPEVTSATTMASQTQTSAPSAKSVVPGPTGSFVQELRLKKIDQNGIQYVPDGGSEKDILGNLTLRKIGLLYKNVACPQKVRVTVEVLASTDTDLAAGELKAKIEAKNTAATAKAQAKIAALQAELAKLTPAKPAAQ